MYASGWQSLLWVFLTALALGVGWNLGGWLVGRLRG